MEDKNNVIEMKKGYGVGNVVGGFGRVLTPEESIPYAINRTILEHHQLKNAIDICSANMKPENFVKRSLGKGPGGKEAFKLVLKQTIEIGCGYGRNLPVLAECSSKSFGMERDPELYQIATDLNPLSTVLEGEVFKNRFGENTFDLLITFTFLQHLVDQDEFRDTIREIQKIVKPGGCIIIVEETDPEISDDTCVGRTSDFYEELFSGFEMIATAIRRVECTYPKMGSGSFLIMRKKGGKGDENTNVETEGEDAGDNVKG